MVKLWMANIYICGTAQEERMVENVVEYSKTCTKKATTAMAMAVAAKEIIGKCMANMRHCEESPKE